jgi:hypothetical protein
MEFGAPMAAPSPVRPAQPELARSQPEAVAPATASQIAVAPPMTNSPAKVQAEVQSARPEPSRVTPADEQLAQHWLSHTNERPVVRVHYDAGDVLKLVEAGRGLIVASSRAKGHSRELYVQSTAGTAPLFAPYTRTVADRFSAYSLTLDAAPELAGLTAAFPVYFPDGAVELSFVPDRALATRILAEVANASRENEIGVAKQTVFDGQLTVEAGEPRFSLLEIRSGSKRLVLSSAR